MSDERTERQETGAQREAHHARLGSKIQFAEDISSMGSHGRHGEHADTDVEGHMRIFSQDR